MKSSKKRVPLGEAKEVNIHAFTRSPVSHQAHPGRGLDAEDAEKKPERFPPQIQIQLAFPGTSCQIPLPEEPRRLLRGLIGEGST